MKMKKPSLKPLVLAAGTLVWCALNLHAQTAPTIATQPASQTNLVGTAMSFSVTANGTGPLIYQWQFNGTNLPNNVILTTPTPTSMNPMAWPSMPSAICHWHPTGDKTKA
jgi:hypothetical protein